jgi:hypothetical protein
VVVRCTMLLQSTLQRLIRMMDLQEVPVYKETHYCHIIVVHPDTIIRSTGFGVPGLTTHSEVIFFNLRIENTAGRVDKHRDRTFFASTMADSGRTIGA